MINNNFNNFITEYAVYPSVNNEQTENLEKCPICLDEVSTGASISHDVAYVFAGVVVKTDKVALHAVHEECMNTWRESQKERKNPSSCTLCRKEELPPLKNRIINSITKSGVLHPIGRFTVALENRIDAIFGESLQESIIQLRDDPIVPLLLLAGVTVVSLSASYNLLQSLF